MQVSYFVPRHFPDRPSLMLCDVDRTLLTHRHVLLPEVMKAALALPFPLILASARSPVGVRPIAQAVGADGLAVCYNGAWIGDLETGESLHDAPIDPPLARLIFDKSRELGNAPAWFLPDRVLCHPADRARVSLRTDVTGDPLECDAAPTLPPRKLLLIAKPEEIPEFLPRLRALSADVAVTRSGPGLIEVTRADVSKGHALRLVAEHLGIPRSRVAAAGDSENDKEMLDAAVLAIVPRNAARKLRWRADKVFGHCDAGGMAEAFQWLASLPETL